MQAAAVSVRVKHTINGTKDRFKSIGQGHKLLTGELSMLWRLFLLFLIWLLSALESSGFSNSKLHSNSPETDMTAPQLSNSPQYY